MVNVSGFKVYPTEVENVIYQHPAVAEAAIYGVPDALKGEIVKANIVLKEGHAITEEQIIEFCSRRIAAYKVPRVINFVDSIPKNPTGKVLKQVLRQQLISQFAAVTS
jgi:long-chain acyl-CoA synthetase